VPLRVAGAGGAVRVAGGEEAIAVDELPAAFAAPGPAGLALHVAEGRFNGAAWASLTSAPTGEPPSAQRSERTPALRR